MSKALDPLAIYQVIGERGREGDTLNDLAQIHDARGDHVTALEYLNQSLAIHQAIGDRMDLCDDMFLWDVFIL